jgi:hypothetical protein
VGTRNLLSDDGGGQARVVADRGSQSWSSRGGADILLIDWRSKVVSIQLGC